MKAQCYRNGKIPGRGGYGINDDELKCLFETNITIVEIAKQMDISQWTVLKHLKKLGLRRTIRHFITNPDFFNIMTPENSYWGGFIAADGCVSRNALEIELSIIDAEHLKTICKFVGRDDSLFFRKRYRNGKIFEYASVSVLSAKIIEDLFKNFNIVPCKSLILQPPDLPRCLRRHFIRGYFDGDGSIGWHKHNRTIRLNFASGSKVFLEWIWDTIREELGCLGQRSIGYSKDSKTKTLSLSGDAAIRIFEWMYEDGGEGLCLERKLKIFKKLKVRLQEKRDKRTAKRQNIVQEMVELYKQGMSYKEVAEILGVTREKVTYYMKSTDIPKHIKKTDSIAGQKLKARDQEMLSAYVSGETVDSLSLKFGICKSSVWVALSRTKKQNNGISKNT